MSTLTRAKHLYRVIDERAGERRPPLLAVSIHHGVVPRHEITDDEPRADDLTGYKVCKEGDLVLNRMRAFQGAIGLSPTTGLVSPDYLVLRPSANCEPRYLHHLFRSRWFVGEMVSRLRGIGGTETGSVRTPRINAEDLGDIRLTLPTRGEQRAIADYLDAETARIDALIAKKRRLIELVRERVRADFVRLVLGDEGMEGEASPSGIYRTVSSGWRETRLRHIGCEVQTGPFGSQLHAEEYVEGGWPVVNPMNLVGGDIEAVGNMTVTDAKRHELIRHMLRPGDIVFGRRGEMGRAGLVKSKHDGWLCGTGSLRLRVVGDLLIPEYLALLLGTPPARAYFQLASVGSTMDNLNSEIVLAFPTLIPPLDAQRRIVSALHQVKDLGERAGQRLTDQIELLMEHRQALITAAVTGELSIPEVAA